MATVFHSTNGAIAMGTRIRSNAKKPKITKSPTPRFLVRKSSSPASHQSSAFFIAMDFFPRLTSSISRLSPEAPRRFPLNDQTTIRFRNQGGGERSVCMHLLDLLGYDHGSLPFWRNFMEIGQLCFSRRDRSDIRSPCSLRSFELSGKRGL